MRGAAARSHSTMADRIAVIGAGQMGNGIAHVFAQSGFDVVMIDVAQSALDRGRDTIVKNLDRQIKKGTLAETDRGGILDRLSTSTAPDAVTGAALVVEAATEDRDLKFRLFADLDLLAREGAVVGAEPSSLSIARI